ncbi:MAG: NUDIX domain-containing protein [Williamsia sp.]|nr:NUDIX domain-containing protein [Williamsia sp.]
MPRKSAGILLYRLKTGVPEVFLVHPGGPLHAKKDLGSWSIPKGEFEEGEEPLAAARREFKEETGAEIGGDFTALSPIKQKSGKIVWAWAVKGDFDEKELVCNLFTMEWPPRSGRYSSFPEVDRGEWFGVELARQKMIPAQAALVDELLQLLGN